MTNSVVEKNAKVYNQHDNARFHVARDTKAEKTGYGWTVFAPNLRRHLPGKKFVSRNGVKKELTDYFVPRSK
uniref:Uncharacterized protein n=1 Tax=Caenorhabditis japonica TaxID=281687 RepID=A0A8R1DJT2_CAEJA